MICKKSTDNLFVKNSEFFSDVACIVTNENVTITESMNCNTWNSQVFSGFVTDILYELSANTKVIFARKNNSNAFDWLVDEINNKSIEKICIISDYNPNKGIMLCAVAENASKTIFSTFVFCTDDYQLSNACEIYMLPLDAGDDFMGQIENKQYLMSVKPVGDGHGIIINKSMVDVLEIINKISISYNLKLKIVEADE